MNEMSNSLEYPTFTKKKKNKKNNYKKSDTSQDQINPIVYDKGTKFGFFVSSYLYRIKKKKKYFKSSLLF